MSAIPYLEPTCVLTPPFFRSLEITPPLLFVFPTRLACVKLMPSAEQGPNTPLYDTCSTAYNKYSVHSG